MEDKEKSLIVKSEIDFNSINHNETLSFTFNKIDIDNLHIKNTNMNLIEVSIIRKFKLKKIIFENCVLGNLHFFDYSKTKEIQLINQNVDNYFIDSVSSMYFPNILIFENNNISNLSFLKNKTYDKLFIKNNNIKGNLNTLNDARVNNLYLEDINSYTISDLEYLRERLIKKRISKIFFNDSEVDEKKIFYIERKLKIEKLIKQNA